MWLTNSRKLLGVGSQGSFSTSKLSESKLLGFTSSLVVSPQHGITSLLHNLQVSWLNIYLFHRLSMNTNYCKIFHIKTACKKKQCLSNYSVMAI